MIEAIGPIARDLFAMVGMLVVPVLVGRWLLMRGRRSVTMAGRGR